MASVVMASTSTSGSSFTAGLTELNYFWATKTKIQDFLDQDSPIKIGTATNQITEANARRVENAVVRNIVSYLKGSYTDISTSYYADVLSDIASKLTAAELGVGRYTASMGISDPQDWTNRYKNEAWTSIIDLFLNQTLTGLTVSGDPYWKRVWKCRRRERAVVINA